MNEEIKQQWVAALRSGEYQQGLSRLRIEDSYCCLGVLCDLAVKAGVPVTVKLKGFRKEGVYDGLTSILPRRVMTWAGLKEEAPEIPNEELAGSFDLEETSVSLAALNDIGVPFSEIADVIEEYL